MATETVDETTSAAAGDLARVSAMLEAIERLSESLEDTSDARSFALVTALQACTESARRACAAAEAAVQEVSHRTPPDPAPGGDAATIGAEASTLGDRVDVLIEDLDKVTYLLQMASEALPQLDTGCDKARAALWAADVGIARLNVASRA